MRLTLGMTFGEHASIVHCDCSDVVVILASLFFLQYGWVKFNSG